MAIHVPLSEDAKAEARILMLSANNILSPKDGSPIVTPSQDMVLGNYYITIEEAGLPNEGKVYKNSNEALMAYERKEISLHTRIVVPVNSFKYKIFTEEQKNMYLVTTVGKLKFNEILPDTFPYLNEPDKDNIGGITPMKYFLSMGTDIKKAVSEMEVTAPFVKKTLVALIAAIFKRYKTTETSVFLDRLKDLGFKYSTISGISISMSDVVTSKEKEKIINDTNEKVNKVNKQFQRGLITDDERHNSVIDLWNHATDEISDELKELASKEVKNPILMMMNSLVNRWKRFFLFSWQMN